MSSTMQILSALAIAGALSVVSATAAIAQDAQKRVKLVFIRVIYEADSPELAVSPLLTMATSVEGWTPCPGDAYWRKDWRPPPRAGELRLDRLYSIPLDRVLDPDFEFKFTRGSWETVEVGPDGRDIPNRKFTPQQIAHAIAMSERGIEGPEGAIEIRISGFADQRPVRWPDLKVSKSTVTGDVRIEMHASKALGNTRALRVWLPPGYYAPENADRRYPVLYMNDGQNLFDAATSFAGEWGVDETATRLIEAGKIPPMIVVGVDNAGASRGDEYLPRNAGARRPDMGGKADDYLRMISDEVTRYINFRFRTLTGPEHTAFGGSSFGGVVTLHAAMTRPDLFGAILVESPSLWVEDGAFLQRVVECKDWPQRVYLAQGDREYGEGEQSTELVEMTRKVEAAMREAGLGKDRLMVVIGEGDAHNEAAWAKRLPAAMEFLFAIPAPGVEDQPPQ